MIASTQLTWLEPLSSPSFLSQSECLRFDIPSSGPKDDFIGIPGVDSDTGAPLAILSHSCAHVKSFDGPLSIGHSERLRYQSDLIKFPAPISDDGTPLASNQSTPEAVSGAKSPIPEPPVAVPLPPVLIETAPSVLRAIRSDSRSLSRSRSRSRVRHRAKSSSSETSRSRSRSRSRHRNERRRERSRDRDGKRRNGDRSRRQGIDDRRDRRYERQSRSRSYSPRRSRSFERSRRRR